jgi:hypothetical protein
MTTLQGIGLGILILIVLGIPWVVALVLGGWHFRRYERDRKHDDDLADDILLARSRRGRSDPISETSRRRFR